jgi:predicted flavoprotein YhiN
MKYDVIVIGGGPSGLMASIAASQKGAKVLLVEKGNRLGRKLAISGGGRCNVTNAGDIDEIIKHIPGNGRFLYSCLSTFSNKDIIRFFEGLGIKLKEEDRGRMFPVSDKASDVVQALVNRIQKQGVEIRVNAPVKRVLYQPHGVEGVELKNGAKEITHEGEMIFTHFGLSGPAALRCSQFVVKLLKKSNTDHVLITLDLFPKSHVNDVAEKIRNMAQSHPKKTIKNVLKGYLPERLIPLILEKRKW